MSGYLQLRLCAVCFFALIAAVPGYAQDPVKPVSYYKEIRPIFQANCQGCHQPAKARGEYVMTAFDKLLAGGQSGEPAIVPKQPDKSHLVEQITPHGGKAKMPEGKSPIDCLFGALLDCPCLSLDRGPFTLTRHQLLIRIHSPQLQGKGSLLLRIEFR